ncbi:nucleotidyltransferase family protein [bacterium]|nr:MAG: nucleotidyltransferase family protein [bacterium]
MVIQPRQEKVAAIVLAAGAGKRIGRSKALLPLGDSNFLDSIISHLIEAGISHIIAVISPEVSTKLDAKNYNVDFALNGEKHADMWSSLLIGVAQLWNAVGCLIIPVDHPFVKAETFRLLKESFLRQPASIIVPTYQEQSGHPVVLPYDWAKTLPSISVDGGLRTAIRNSGLNVCRIETNDSGILRNINEQKDLEIAP